SQERDSGDPEARSELGTRLRALGELLDGQEHLPAHHESDRVHEVWAEAELLAEALPGNTAPALKQPSRPLRRIDQVEPPDRLRSLLGRGAAEHQCTLGLESHDLRTE